MSDYHRNDSRFQDFRAVDKALMDVGVAHNERIKIYKKNTFILPNANQCSGIFDESLVQSQLISSGSIAYQQLMRIGFPSHMSIADLFNKFKSNSEFEDHTSINPKDFCNLLLRSCGLKWKDFKLGNTQICFRSGKLEMFSEKLKEDSKVIKPRLDKVKLLRKKLKVAIIFARFCAISKGLRKKLIDLVNEMQPEEQVDIPRKKVKLNKTSNQLMTAITQTEGNEDELPNLVFHCLFPIFHGIIRSILCFEHFDYFKISIHFRSTSRNFNSPQNDHNSFK